MIFFSQLKYLIILVFFLQVGPIYEAQCDNQKLCVPVTLYSKPNFWTIPDKWDANDDDGEIGEELAEKSFCGDVERRKLSSEEPEDKGVWHWEEESVEWRDKTEFDRGSVEGETIVGVFWVWEHVEL